MGWSEVRYLGENAMLLLILTMWFHGPIVELRTPAMPVGVGGGKERGGFHLNLRTWHAASCIFVVVIVIVVVVVVVVVVVASGPPSPSRSCSCSCCRCRCRCPCCRHCRHCRRCRRCRLRRRRHHHRRQRRRCCCCCGYSCCCVVLLLLPLLSLYWVLFANPPKLSNGRFLQTPKSVKSAVFSPFFTFAEQKNTVNTNVFGSAPTQNHGIYEVLSLCEQKSR